MIPIRITLSGFMSYVQAQTLDFSGDSLWVLIGKNASGKSTVFDAMTYALFGEARAVGVNNAMLVNHKSDRAEIEFDFMVGSSLYRVRRTIDAAGHTTRQAILLFPQSGDKPKELPVPGTDKAHEFRHWVENEVGLNLDVFTTAMMLRQGKADALLDSDTETRYNVLSKLIDLSRYEALAEKAKVYRNHWQERAATYRESLQQIESVSDTDLDTARQKIEIDRSSAEKAWKRMSDLTALLGESKEWEMLSGSLEASRRRRVELEKLIHQEGEITQHYQRLGDLRAVLPSLRSISNIHERINSTENLIEHLEQDETNCAEPLHLAELHRNELSEAVKELELQVESYTMAGRRAFERQAGLDATVKLLDQIDEDTRLVNGFKQDLAAFPSDLDDLVISARADCESHFEAKDALPNLTRLLNERDELTKAHGTRQKAEQRIAELEGQRRDLEEKKQDAQNGAGGAEQVVSNSREELSRAKAHQEEARERRERFDEVAGEARCRYCGQEMSEAHKEKERLELQRDLEKWNGAVWAAQKKYSEAVAAQKTATDRLKTVETAFTALEMNLKDAKRDFVTTAEVIQSKQMALVVSYHALPASYQVMVAASEPVSLTGWLDTTYPAPQDLRQISDLVKRLPEKKRVLEGLETQQSSRKTTFALWQARSKELDGARSRLPDGWEEARELQAKVIDEKTRADKDAATALKSLKQTRVDLEKAAGDASRLAQQQVARRSTLETSRTSLQKDQQALEAQITLIPITWHGEAAGFNASQIADLQKELESLGGYERQYQELLASHQNLAEVNERIAKDEERIASLPTESQQPSVRVDQTFKASQKASSDADLRHQTAVQNLANLETQKAQYAEMDRLQKNAARKAHLYGILTEQLGERGIQRMLVLRAERGIVRYANDLLDNLTGGRSQLRLREDGGNRKALDLEVTDSVTGAEKPLLVGLASGSQKFRIAISLALAIGQYIGHESHHIESVVIDEGFGSLDSEGRESVIQELHNLRQHLKRIILVSHQEEFSKGFTTGYRIQIEDGASKVRLLDS